MEMWPDLPGLRIAAEAVADAKKSRIATINRVERGGVSDPMLKETLTRAAKGLEEECNQLLMAEYKTVVPQHVRDWAAQIPGLASGELFPRILGSLGHPRLAQPYRWEDNKIVPAGPMFDRTVRQLWQFAGCGDPDSIPYSQILGHEVTREDKLRAGKRTTVRPLLYTWTSWMVRQHTRSPAVGASKYWQLFEQTKKEAADKRHVRTCRNRKRPPMTSNGCGTSKNPEWGEVGSPWRPGHINMHTHRIVQKRWLQELWEVCGQ